MGNEQSCPVGQKFSKTLGKCILTPQALAGSEIDFYRKADKFDMEDGFQHTDAIMNRQTPVRIVTVDQYNKIADALDELPPDLLRSASKTLPAGRWGYTKGFTMTDGKRYMMIDTQGHDYPRWKGVIKNKGRVLKF